MNELTDDLVMNVDGLGKANRLPRQTLNPCSKVQVLPLDRLGVGLGDQVLILRKIVLIGLPAIGTVTPCPPRVPC